MKTQPLPANARRKLLLLSTSTVHGSGYLDYAENEIRDFLGNITSVLFVPLALADCDGYAAKVQARLAAMSITVSSLHRAADMPLAIRNAEALFIGGGNTFRLLKKMQDAQLLPVIRARVASGMPYLGSSAGTNIAAPTIRTTNDMPIVEPASFEALGLVPFQINPHYLDADPGSTHMGETREERIVQYLEENDTPVVALREGALLRIENNACELRGSTGGRLFRRNAAPVELRAGRLPDLL